MLQAFGCVPEPRHEFANISDAIKGSLWNPDEFLGADVLLFPRWENPLRLQRYNLFWILVFLPVLSALFVFRGSFEGYFAVGTESMQKAEKDVFFFQVVQEWALHFLLFIILMLLNQAAGKMNRWIWAGLLGPVILSKIAWVNWFTQDYFYARRTPYRVSLDLQNRILDLVHPKSHPNNILGRQSNCLTHYYQVLQETGNLIMNVPWIHNPLLAKYYQTFFRQNDVLEQPIPAQQVNPERLKLDYVTMYFSNVGTIIFPLRIQDARYKLLNKSSPFIHRTNVCLKSIFLQPGEQQIEFVYQSSLFVLGLWTSAATLVTLLILSGVGVYSRFRHH